MEWDNKVKMIQLGNQRTSSNEARKAFQDYVLEHIESFDGQAWDMFVNLIDLDIDEMKTDIEFWKQLYPLLSTLEDDGKFGFRTIMRLEMSKIICEKDLGLK